MERDQNLIVLPYFSPIEECQTTEDLLNMLNSSDLSSYKMSNTKYPRLNTSITKEQIEKLIEQEIIKDSGDINPKKIGDQDTLSQLLYSFLWKQGDIQKLKHIISGFRNQDPISDTGIVLHYFGKHLADNKNPIIDQHVIRAYSYSHGLKEVNKETLSKKDKPNIEFYINWFKNELPDFIKDSTENRYLVDQIMYARGKKVKAEVYPRPFRIY